MMLVTAELILFPYGAREGLPVAAIDITGDGDLPTMNELMAPLSRAGRPGTGHLWLRNVPWGSYEFDRRIAEFTYALPAMAVLATADTTSTAWSNLMNIGWVLDATAQVSAPTTAAALRLQTVERSTLFMPAVQELVVTKIDSSNLLAPVLTSLANMWGVETGTIYVTPEQVQAATVAVAGAGGFAARVR